MLAFRTRKTYTIHTIRSAEIVCKLRSIISYMDGNYVASKSRQNLASCSSPTSLDPKCATLCQCAFHYSECVHSSYICVCVYKCTFFDWILCIVRGFCLHRESGRMCIGWFGFFLFLFLSTCVLWSKSFLLPHRRCHLRHRECLSFCFFSIHILVFIVHFANNLRLFLLTHFSMALFDIILYFLFHLLPY